MALRSDSPRSDAILPQLTDVRARPGYYTEGMPFGLTLVAQRQDRLIADLQALAPRAPYTAPVITDYGDAQIAGRPAAFVLAQRYRIESMDNPPVRSIP